jgi:hypothetical protein
MIKVVFTDDKKITGNSPAVIEENLDNGDAVIYLNRAKYNKLSKFQKDFVVLHEMGHYVLNTDSEIEADGYAFDRLAGTQYESLSKSLGAIVELLPTLNTSRPLRLKAMTERVLEWDFKNGNKSAKKELEAVRAMDAYTFEDYFNHEYMPKADIKKNSLLMWGDVGQMFYKMSMGESLKLQAEGANKANDNSAKTSNYQMLLIFGVLCVLCFFALKKL